MHTSARWFVAQEMKKGKPWAFLLEYEVRFTVEAAISGL
ncbi:hypothetical protein GCHA_1666 [Paraglaciecola chathamensis S18K6]|uniref:Transposase n=1 Tax=Paraglaciecola chathamensis S18K6 TaxID=1127672 RepID=A0AAV3UWW4_9ALTE|nr:hypothetical protein GCHA_1666 [Paraglaciecola chathamensis S18K6]